VLLLEPAPLEPVLSAIVVVVDRARLVEKCLASFVSQTEPRFEAVVVLNGASPEVVQTVRGHSERDPRIRPVAIAPTTASEARNSGLRVARGALLYFLDDDVEVPRDGFAAAVRFFAEHPDVAIAGGPNLTPPDDPEFAQLSGELLASAFGTGITHHRYTKGREGSASERNLTLCNLVVARRLFDGGARFPRPFGGEENVLMGRASHLGHRLWYSPTLWVHHRRRSSPAEHLVQVSRYGFGRGVAMNTGPRTIHLAFFAPLALLGYTASSPVLFLAGGSWALSPLALYFALAALSSVRIATRRGRPSWIAGLTVLFFLTHLAYGVGLVRGLVRGLEYRRKGRAASALDIP
jgi:GT2 family glycosyltransferase